tara:strand:+ start:773 stop:1450 length:678 start_codon:yes stop_codon:yes gene_type:complete
MDHYNPSRNLYSPFDDYNEDLGTSCPNRKAAKKLREIEKLKNKINKTPEEYKKIREESIWRAVLEPVCTGGSETKEDIEKRKNKQKEKRKIKEFEKKQRIEKEKHKKEIATIQGNYREKIRILEEEKISLKNENQKLKLLIQNIRKEKNSSSRSSSSSIYHQKEQVSMEDKIEEEFLDLYSQERCYKKTYKIMILKYHPDKCASKTIGEQASAILNILKEKYVDK